MSDDDKKKKTGRSSKSGRSKNLSNSREVRDENTLAEWERQVLVDTDLDYKVRFVLRALTLQIDQGDWTVKLKRRVLRDELGMPHSSLYKYVRDALGTDYVEVIGQHTYQAEDRTVDSEVLILRIPGS